MTELFNELTDKEARLTQSVRLMAKYGREFAEAEAEYKTALMQTALQLRADGMPATLINMVVYGKVAKERLKRDTAEVMYRTSLENINALKLQIRLLDNQIAREWGQ